MIPAALCERARAAATKLADDLAAVPLPPPDDDRGPASPRWREQSLAAGAAGIAVLHAVAARAGLGPWDRVHAWLALAAREELSAGPGAGLWYGAPAVAFAIRTAAPEGTYRTAISDLDRAVCALAVARLDAARTRMATGSRPSRREYDLVHGLTGLGAYLLRFQPDTDLTRQLLTYLVRLTEPLRAGDQAGAHAPGWWTSDVPSGQPAGLFAEGFADLGMAHGITGPLALLALAMRQGVTVPGHGAAIERICGWLDCWRQDGPAGPWWPERITYQELCEARCLHPGPRRPSWCYGTPGIARAQQLAGLATGDEGRQATAEHALATCLTDPAQIAQLTGPGLCHGLAGTLLTAWHAAADAQAPGIDAIVPGLLDVLLSDVSADPRPGLIEGTAGAAATLRAITRRPAAPGWEICLLLN